jgi:hopanoid biosynthesis associated radical SAM protein HpnH
MSVSIRQRARIGTYLFRQRLAKREKFPLLVELEPLFQCNLACAGCGKIQHPEHVLKRRMPVEQAVSAVVESGAPMVSIAGGEPLVHPDIHVIAAELIKRKRFVYLCTNALLLERKLDKFKPSPYFSWAIHLDGLKERHDASVEREGVFEKAVSAIRAAKAAGFRVTTNTTFFTHDSPKTVMDVLDFLNDELEVDDMEIMPAYAYEKAPDQEHFMGVEQTRSLFAAALGEGRRKRWRLNHTPLYLRATRCSAGSVPAI